MYAFIFHSTYLLGLSNFFFISYAVLFFLLYFLYTDIML